MSKATLQEKRSIGHFPQNERPIKPSLLGAMHALSNKVKSGENSHWHFSITAPRWALRSPERETLTSTVTGLAALLLAALGVLLAWHASDKLATSKSGLAVQIGPWVAVGLLLAGAGVAAHAAFGSKQLHLRMMQLTSNETAAKALADSVTDCLPEGTGTARAASTNGDEALAIHAAAAAKQAATAADAANGAVPDTAAASAAAAAAAAHAAAANALRASAADEKATPTDVTPAAQDAATTTSPKVWAGTIAGAVAFSFWTIAAATFWKNTFSSDALAALVGSTTAILAAAAAYLKSDPMRSRPRS